MDCVKSRRTRRERYNGSSLDSIKQLWHEWCVPNARCRCVFPSVSLSLLLFFSLLLFCYCISTYNNLNFLSYYSSKNKYAEHITNDWSLCQFVYQWVEMNYKIDMVNKTQSFVSQTYSSFFSIYSIE